MKNGIVKWYNLEKGFGFINDDDGRDVFVHRSCIKEQGPLKELYEGQEVTFDTAQTDKGLQAINVMKVNAKK